MDKEQAIQEILEDLEKTHDGKSKSFRSYMNQPELININSTNAIPQITPITSQTNNSFYNFTINLPRPALDTKSLQLLKAVIPQAQCNIPDYSLVFPYYKLRVVPVSGNGELYFIDLPTFDNLYFVRLLPSYYKPELIQDQLINQPFGFNDIGYNRSFNDYAELANELEKACKHDLSFDAGSHYLANDISITYDNNINKFIFTGLNVDTLNVYPQWDGIDNYINGDVVEYDDITYLCIKPVTQGLPPPDDTEYWLNVTQYLNVTPISNVYLIAGYTDPNVQTLLEYIENESRINDFPTLSSIPGNKYVQQQTLSRRLGFTWDGTGMITTQKINNYIDNGITYGGTGALFYNRFRPIPDYRFALPPLLDASPYLADYNSYTADGYCNLVYSSIINIYTSIIGTSSVDTKRDSNLLAMVEMNCGNLGIGMINNFIDTKLRKIQPDIYSIFIELRDENGEPYLLTNNAVVSLLLKLTYE